MTAAKRPIETLAYREPLDEWAGPCAWVALMLCVPALSWLGITLAWMLGLIQPSLVQGWLLLLTGQCGVWTFRRYWGERKSWYVVSAFGQRSGGGVDGDAAGRVLGVDCACTRAIRNWKRRHATGQVL